MFYLNLLKDKYKMPYICNTLKDENHYRIQEESQTTLPKKYSPNTKKQEDPIIISLKQDNRRRRKNQIGEEENESLMEW